jgi:hypothetical protein
MSPSETPGLPGHPKFDPLAKYGVPIEQWLTLSQKERNRLHNRLWHKTHSKPKARKFDPSRHGLTMEEWLALSMRERKLITTRTWARIKWETNRDERRAEWRNIRKRKIERKREQERALYWADPEKHRRKARDSYRRHHEKRLASFRAYYAKKKSISNVRHNPDEVYRRVVAAIPKTLPRFARDDIASELCLAVLEGKLLVDNIEKEVAGFMRSYNREYDTFKTVSLDAPVPGRDGETYMDRLPADGAEPWPAPNEQ